MNQGSEWMDDLILLKSTLEIIFVTIPILIVGITIFMIEDFKLFNLMELVGMIDKLVMFSV